MIIPRTAGFQPALSPSAVIADRKAQWRAYRFQHVEAPNRVEILLIGAV